jgi:dolichol-phosphate mannosyltransferase
VTTATRLVSVVVPCLNESESLPQLHQKLSELQAECADRCEFEIVLVDDGSSDGTPKLAEELFGDGFRLNLQRHEKNRGIAAALMTGIRASGGDTIVTIDADCTFDPADIPQLLDQLRDGVSVVIGSPYHPEGGVDHVPGWRILLSRACSRMYRALFRNPVNCYTGCFRAFRAADARRIALDNHGFVGVVELLWKLDGQPGRFVEVPVRLSNRKYGQSKMKTVRAMAKHFLLMVRIATRTISRPQPRPTGKP